MHTINDEVKLIQGIVEKDEASFRQFVEKYQDFVVNVCYKFLRDRADAEDIAQEVFIKVFDSAHTFRGDAKITTWLYRISANKSLNFIRSRKKTSLFDRLDNYLNTDGEFRNHISQSMTDEENENRKSKYLYQAIETLSDKQRTAFTLNKLENLSYKEISEIMNLSLSSVESLIHRAKLKLQKKLFATFKKLN
jgi:RNA polymerase sigma-70 factor (ECF subfamily)